MHDTPADDAPDCCAEALRNADSSSSPVVCPTCGLRWYLAAVHGPESVN